MSQIDAFSNLSKGLSSPVDSGGAITPHDTNALPRVYRAVWVGTGGDIVLRLRNDAGDVTMTNVPGGTLLPLRPTHIRATGTTASGLVGLE
jgi:hypothetical protein